MVVLYGACRVARIRSVKPDFFLDFELAKLSLASRLFFIGLWTQADVEGRLKDDPEKLKVQIFPWDKVNSDKLLSELHPKFIIRYEVSGVRYIQIRTWKAHQRINGKEADSSSQLPPVPKTVGSDGEAPGKHQGSTGEAPGTSGREGKGREGKGVVVGKGNGKGMGGEIITPLTLIQNQVKDFITTTAPLKAIKDPVHFVIRSTAAYTPEEVLKACREVVGHCAKNPWWESQRSDWGRTVMNWVKRNTEQNGNAGKLSGMLSDIGKKI